MDSTRTASNDVERLVSIALLGLAGCALTVALTANPEQLTPAKTAGAFAGLFFAFVAIAGVLDTIRG